jgi:PAS domain S-box-containing protein
MKNRVIEPLNNNHFKEIFMKAPNPMAITTPKEGIYIEVNEAFTKFYEVQRQEAIGKTTVECGFVSKERRSKLINDIREKGQAKNILIKYRAKNNELHCLLINTMPVRTKKQVLLMSVGTDISRIKLAKDSQQEDILIKSFDSIDDTGIILIGNDENKQSYIFYMNEVAKKALEAMSIQDLLEDLDRNESICISTKTGYYHVKTISTHRSSPLKMIFVERFPESQIIKRQMKQQGLTPRQQEIALLIATGYSNMEIAEKLFITEYTVKDHLKKIFQMIGVHSRGELCPKILRWR